MASGSHQRDAGCSCESLGACQKHISYANWSVHCKKEHADRVPNACDGNDGNDDAVQPGQRAAGVGNAVSKEPEPKKSYVQRKNLGTPCTKGAKANDSSDGKVASKKKSKVAPKKKSQPE